MLGSSRIQALPLLLAAATAVLVLPGAVSAAATDAADAWTEQFAVLERRLWAKQAADMTELKERLTLQQRGFVDQLQALERGVARLTSIVMPSSGEEDKRRANSSNSSLRRRHKDHRELQNGQDGGKAPSREELAEELEQLSNDFDTINNVFTTELGNLDTRLNNDVSMLYNKLTLHVGAINSRLGPLELSVQELLSGTATDGSSAPTTAAPLPVPAPVVAPVSAPTPPVVGGPSAGRCGCATSCTDAVWNALAPADAPPGFTCGSRIEYIMGANSVSQEEACRVIAGETTGEYPDICAGCDPDRCEPAAGAIDDGATPSGEDDTTGDNGLDEILAVDADLYCFPPYAQRVRYTNVWSGNFNIEVKRETNGGLCGPSDNAWSDSTQSVKFDAATQELKLYYRRLANVWTSSEVRIVLPQEQMPYRYGKYKFSVKSIKVLKVATMQELSTVLPADLVLGLFTWDTTDNFALNENWNHEVDIELSRWGNPTNSDAQFLAQPPEEPHYFRFYTGPGNTYDQAGHTYEFDWNPNSIRWYTTANNGVEYTYTTQQAIESNLPDRIQCLPADVEVRINLWNFRGINNMQPMGNDEMVEVIIDNFEYTPSSAQQVPTGGACSKDCQCAPDGTAICTADEGCQPV